MNPEKCEPFDKKGFAKRLKELRKDLYPTPDDIAFYLDLSKRQYLKYEKEDSHETPNTAKLSLLIQLLQTSPGHLVQGVGPKFIDLKSAKKLQAVMERAFNVERPNYGILINRLLELEENQLQLLIDLIPVLKDYNPKLNEKFFDEVANLKP